MTNSSLVQVEKVYDFTLEELSYLIKKTDEEIQNAVHFAKQTAGWSTYVNGMLIDFDLFKREVDQIIEHVKTAQSEMV